MTTDIYLHNDKQPYDVWETVTLNAKTSFILRNSDKTNWMKFAQQIRQRSIILLQN